MPSGGESGTGGTPAELRYQFWLLVGVLNVAMLALTLGTLLLVSRARPGVGVGLLAVGIGASLFAWGRYRRVREMPAE